MVWSALVMLPKIVIYSQYDVLIHTGTPYNVKLKLFLCLGITIHVCFAANIKNFSTVQLICSSKLFFVPAGAPILSHYYYAHRPNLCRQLRTAPYGQDPWWHMLNYFIFQFFKFNMSLVLSLHATPSYRKLHAPPGHLPHHFVWSPSPWTIQPSNPSRWAF